MLRAAASQNIGVRLQRIVQQPTNFERATGTIKIVYPTKRWLKFCVSFFPLTLFY
jgi:hypothetical protein